MNKIKQILDFVKGNPKDEITYTNNIININGLKFGSDNEKFAQKFITYFQKLRNINNLK